ncbi:MAG: hypothetical protein KAI67_00215 [Candidatus Pacebacteria bacterium]|nr:hypothetical protein [Candidatus Paceibacterota bacterium]
MTKLYNGRYIKTDLIKDALEDARHEGKLKRVPTNKIQHFVDRFEEEMEKYKRKVGNNIDPKEVMFLLKKMTEDKHDRIRDSELKEIGKILVDRKFII